MSGNLFEITVRRIVIVALLGVVAFGAWRMASGSAADPFERAESRLEERVDEYIALRKADDQETIYRMHDPEQRKVKSLREFLEFHGRGVLKVLKMEPEEMHVDRDTQTARVVLHSEVELQPHLLPPPFNDVQEEHPEHLREEGVDALEWVWRDGDWYVRMSRPFMTGRAEDGRPIQQLGAPPQAR